MFKKKSSTGRNRTVSEKYEEALSRSLARRHKQQVANKDQKGISKRDTLFDHKAFPEGMSTWYAKEGQHTIDIIPFIAGPGMPLGRDSSEPVTEEGEFDYLIDVEVHRNIGETKTDYVCPRMNYGKPCPICSYMDNNRLDTEDWKRIKTSRRAIYFVWVHDTPEEEAKGLQLWHVSHFYMEAKLNALVTLPKGGGVRQFSNPINGYNVVFEVQKEGKTKINYVGHALYPRERPIPKKLLEMTFPLEDVIKLQPDYSDMERDFFGTLKSLKSAPESSNSAAGDNFQGTQMEDDVPFDAGGGTTPSWYDGEEDDGSKAHEAAKPKVRKKFKLGKRR